MLKEERASVIRKNSGINLLGKVSVTSYPKRKAILILKKVRASLSEITIHSTTVLIATGS